MSHGSCFIDWAEIKIMALLKSIAPGQGTIYSELKNNG